MTSSNQRCAGATLFYQWPYQGIASGPVRLFSNDTESLVWTQVTASELTSLIGLVFNKTEQQELCAEFNITALTKGGKYKEELTFDAEFFAFSRRPLSIRARRGCEIAVLCEISPHVPHHLYCTKSGLFWVESYQSIY